MPRIRNIPKRSILDSVIGFIGWRHLTASGMKFGRQSRLHGPPSAYVQHCSRVTPRDRVAPRSGAKGNAIGFSHKVILRTQSEKAFIEIGNNVDMGGGAICANNEH